MVACRAANGTKRARAFGVEDVGAVRVTKRIKNTFGSVLAEGIQGRTLVRGNIFFNEAQGVWLGGRGWVEREVREPVCRVVLWEVWNPVLTALDLRWW